MIKAIQLSKSYSGVKVLTIDELTITKGESFGLVGNNGAGKTTFFRLILDLIKADSGNIFSKEVNVKESSEWKYYTGSHLDDGFLIDFLTPEEYFEFLVGVHKLSKGDLEEFYIDFEEFFNGEILGKRKYIRDFSSGNKQKIGIAAALMAKPEIVILDEPFNSLDPTTQIRLKKLLNDLMQQKQVTLLISSHDLDHVTEVCERIVVLEKGKIVEDKPTNENTLNELKEYFTV